MGRPRVQRREKFLRAPGGEPFFKKRRFLAMLTGRAVRARELA